MNLSEGRWIINFLQCENSLWQPLFITRCILLVFPCDSFILTGVITYVIVNILYRLRVTYGIG